MAKNTKQSLDWKKRHKEKQRYYVAKSTAKRFITQLASNDDLKKFAKLIDERVGK